MINCEKCKHCNALPALGYGFCVRHNSPKKLTDLCIDFEVAVGPSDARTKLEENHNHDCISNNHAG